MVCRVWIQQHLVKSCWRVPQGETNIEEPQPERFFPVSRLEAVPSASPCRFIFLWLQALLYKYSEDNFRLAVFRCGQLAAPVLDGSQPPGLFWSVAYGCGLASNFSIACRIQLQLCPSAVAPFFSYCLSRDRPGRRMLWFLRSSTELLATVSQLQTTMTVLLRTLTFLSLADCIDLGTACGKFFTASVLSIIDAGMFSCPFRGRVVDRSTSYWRSG